MLKITNEIFGEKLHRNGIQKGIQKTYNLCIKITNILKVVDTYIHKRIAKKIFQHIILKFNRILHKYIFCWQIIFSDDS